jgi:hypothetical protein
MRYSTSKAKKPGSQASAFIYYAALRGQVWAPWMDPNVTLEDHMEFWEINEGKNQDTWDSADMAHGEKVLTWGMNNYENNCK